jgi:hypothetical protein
MAGLYLIPLRTVGTPTVDGQPLRVGYSIYLTEAVTVSPEVDCLVLTLEN